MKRAEVLKSVFLQYYNECECNTFTFTLFTSLKTLLQRGGCDVHSLGRNSATPLHLAAAMDNDAICKILVRFV